MPLAQLAALRELQQSDLLATLHAVSVGTAQAQAEACATVQKNQAEADALWARYMATYLTPEETVLAQRMAASRQRFREEGLAPTLAVAGSVAGSAADSAVNPAADPAAARRLGAALCCP